MVNRMEEKMNTGIANITFTDEEAPYIAEGIYQIRFYCKAALFSISHIENIMENELEMLDNKVQYYHYYVDSLLNYLGFINERFIPKKSYGKLEPNEAAQKIKMINQNCIYYKFQETDFPILANKMPRNIVEHIDERNIVTIHNYGGVGGFNVLDSSNYAELGKHIFYHQRFYPYTLSLSDDCIVFFDIQCKNDAQKQSYIKIDDLKKELILLVQNIDELNNSFIEWQHKK